MKHASPCVVEGGRGGGAVTCATDSAMASIRYGSPVSFAPSMSSKFTRAAQPHTNGSLRSRSFDRSKAASASSNLEESHTKTKRPFGHGTWWG